MKQQVQAQVLTIYIGEDDKWHGTLLSSLIIERLRGAGIAGVTVLRGTEGYGANAKLHTFRIEVLFEGLPVVMQVVDVPERIAAVLPLLDEVIGEGLVTVHDTLAIRYNKDPKTPKV